MGLEEFENLSYRRRHKFMEWMRKQKKYEQDEGEGATQQAQAASSKVM